MHRGSNAIGAFARWFLCWVRPTGLAANSAAANVALAITIHRAQLAGGALCRRRADVDTDGRIGRYGVEVVQIVVGLNVGGVGARRALVYGRPAGVDRLGALMRSRDDSPRGRRSRAVLPAPPRRQDARQGAGSG